MAKSPKKTKLFQSQYLLIGFSAFLVLIVVLLVMWTVIDLGEGFDQALSVPKAPPPQVQFDIQGFQKLNLNQ